MTVPGCSLGRPARLRGSAVAAAAVSLATLGWLWFHSPGMALPAALLLAIFVFGEVGRRRAAAGMDPFGAEADGTLVAVDAGGRVLRAARRPVVLPWIILARLTAGGADGVAVAVTPASAGRQAFRRLAVRLRESARRDQAPPSGVAQAR